jgi:hypothetical protein
MNTEIFRKDAATGQVTYDKGSVESVAKRTTFCDITDDFLLMERARWLTAEAYAALADPSVGIEEVFAVVSRDSYEEQGRARTIAALSTDPETGASEIVGLVRVVIGEMRPANEEAPPIDAMNFVEPAEGWPHTGRGLNDSQIAELGRFLIVAKFRTSEMRQAGVPAWLTRRLYEAAARVMRERGGRMLYAIMPPYMTRLVGQAGIRICEVPSRLKTEDPLAARVFDQFSAYWLRSAPKLYLCPDALAA